MKVGFVGLGHMGAPMSANILAAGHDLVVHDLHREAGAEVVAAGARYLRIVGPCYGFFGAGLALYFASQGAGRLLWPLLSAVVRLAIAAAGGWLATRWLGTGLSGLFAAMAAALVAMGIINVAAVHFGAWRRRP